MWKSVDRSCPKRCGWLAAALLAATLTFVWAGAARAAACGDSGDPLAVLEEGGDPLCRAAAVQMLAKEMDDAATSALRAALGDRYFHVRWLGLRALSRHAALDAKELAERAIDAHPQVRRLAVVVARKRGLEAELVPRLEEAATGSDAPRAVGALEALAQLDRLSGPTLTAAVEHDAPRVRRSALVLASAGRFDKPAIEAVDAALDDEDPVVRALAAEVLVATDALSLDRLKGLLADPLSMVREIGVRALSELPETEEVRRLQTIVRGMPLPASEWRFTTDPRQHGQDEAWFDPQFDDSDWQRVGIEQPWGDFGHDGYVGDGWYRREIDVPPELEVVDDLELHFHGVDESARVWINGELVGEHDIGPGGWNVPFTLDVTDHIRIGETNQITVRVRNTRGAGGIWRAVWLRPG